MFLDFARRPVGELLEERIKFLDAHIGGLEKNLSLAVSERQFAVSALKDWKAVNAAQSTAGQRTIKQAVLEIMSTSPEVGWSQKRLREEGLSRFDLVIRPASLPPQMQRLSKAGLIRSDGDLWWIQKRS